MEPKEIIVDGQKNEVLAFRINAIKNIAQNKSLWKEIKTEKEIEEQAIEEARKNITTEAKLSDPNKPILRNEKGNSLIKGSGNFKRLTNIELAVKEEKELIEAGIKPPPIRELMLRGTTRQRAFMRDMYKAIKIIIKEKKLTDNPMVQMFVTGIEKAIQGDYSFYKDIMDRYYGKPSTPLDVSGSLDNKIDISDEQYKQLIVLINQRTERNAGDKGSTE